MSMYEVDENGCIEKAVAESLEKVAEVWMAKLTPVGETGIVFAADTAGPRIKVAIYAEENGTGTYYARIIE